MYDYLTGVAGTFDHMIDVASSILAVGSSPSAGSQPGSEGRSPAADTGAQNACPGTTSPPSTSGNSPGTGAGTNLMPWSGSNCNYNPGGCGDNPTCNCGGLCDGVMPTGPLGVA